MIRGLLFFIRFSWRFDKRYLLYNIINQLVSATVPIVAVVMPRFIINELMGQLRMAHLLLYAGILIGYTCIAACLSSWLGWSGFTPRLKLHQE